MFEPNRHVSIGAEWNAKHAHAFVDSVFSETEDVFAKHNHWPAHPADRTPPNGAYLTTLYDGLAGICWSQIELAQLGYGEIRNDYVSAIQNARQATVDGLRQQIAYTNREDYLHGLVLAELGFMVPLLRLDASGNNLQETLELIESNIENEVFELFWGSTGSMLLLASLLESGIVHQDYAQHLVKGVAYFRRTLVQSYSCRANLWRQNLYDEHVLMLGLAHGFAGNAMAILKSLPYLSPADARYWQDEIRRTAIRTATVEEGLANWKQSIDGAREGRDAWVVQFCHGAAGVIVCLSMLMDEAHEFDNLLISAGELIWMLGPLAKGPCFCHGTAGNGWAFLKLFEATRDEMWLDRAKAFAAAAIAQSEKMQQAYGDFRYSLWTGDNGVALFVDACLSQNCAVPMLERF